MTQEPATGAEKPTRVFELICAHVRERIATGELKVGDRLPAERELAEQYKAGRNAVREALRSLEMAGVVRLEKGRNGGAYIRPGNSTRMTLAMQDLLDFGSIGLLELFEARTQIMDRVVRLATQRASEDDYHQLEQLLDEAEQFKKLGQYDRRVERIGEFYAFMALSCHNRVLHLIVTALNDTVRQFIIAVRPAPPEHDTLVAALRRLLRYMRASEVERAVQELQTQLMELYRLLDRSIQIRTARAATSLDGMSAGPASSDFQPETRAQIEEQSQSQTHPQTHPQTTSQTQLQVRPVKVALIE